MTEINSILKHIQINSSPQMKSFSVERLLNCYSWILLQKKSELVSLNDEYENLSKYAQQLDIDIKNKNDEYENLSKYSQQLDIDIKNKNDEFFKSSKYVQKLEKEMNSIKNELFEIHHLNHTKKIFKRDIHWSYVGKFYFKASM